MRTYGECEVRARWGLHHGHKANLVTMDLEGHGLQIWTRYKWVTLHPDARPILGHFASVRAAAVAAWRQGARSVIIRERVA